MLELNLTIHEPARLYILALLAAGRANDFNSLLAVTSLTKGNLSSHLSRLEKAGYIEVMKSFRGKLPHTAYAMTPYGRDALAQYWQQIEGFRLLAEKPAEKKPRAARKEPKPEPVVQVPPPDIEQLQMF